MLKYLLALITIVLAGCQSQSKITSSSEDDLFRLWRSDKFGCKGYRKNEVIDSLILSMSKKDLLKNLGKPNSKFIDAEHQTENYNYIVGSSRCGDCIFCSSQKRFGYGGMILEVILKRDSNDVLRVVDANRSIIN
jgi:hypothetical protein